MPFAAVAGGIGSAVAGSLVSSAMSPSTSGGNSGGSYYVPTGLAAADQGWQGLYSSDLSNYNNNYQQGLDLAGQSLYGGLAAYGQYAPSYLAGAGGAAQQYTNLSGLQQGYGVQEQGMGQTLTQQANGNFGTQAGLINAGQAVYNTAMDPQQALYGQMLNQTQQQAGATNSQYGLGSSAAGAGVQNQALNNFNIDWQNQQLGRQVQGLQAYTGAAGTAAGYGSLGDQQLAGAQSAYGNAAGMYSGAAGNSLMGAELPYSTAQSLTATPGNLANTYGSYMNSNVYGPAESIQGTAIPYMNYGQGAQSVPYQNAYNNAQAMGGAAGSAVSGLGSAVQNSNAYQNLFNPASGSFGGGNFSGAFTSSPYYSGGGNSYGFTM